jgi:membrane protein YdbS with pleckstrin-like domain
MLFSKVDELLEPGEEVQKSVNPSRLDSKYIKTFLTSVALFIGVTAVLIGNTVFQLGMPNLLILAGYVVPAFVYLQGDIERKFTMYHFTDKEIIEEDGMMNKDFSNIPYDRVQDVVLDEQIEERIFDVGDIHIRTAGTDNSETILNGLKNPEKYKREISSRTSQSSTGGGGTNPDDFGSDSGSQGNPSAGTRGGDSGGKGLDSGLIEDELGRVENQIQQLNQKSNRQGLSQSERERWYKLEGQKELLQRFDNQVGDSGGNDFSSGSDLDF